MRPSWYDYFDYVFHTGDDINEIYFLQKGVAEFVIPRYRNICYITLVASQHFGLIDLVGSSIHF